MSVGREKLGNTRGELPRDGEDWLGELPLLDGERNPATARKRCVRLREGPGASGRALGEEMCAAGGGGMGSSLGLGGSSSPPTSLRDTLEREMYLDGVPLLDLRAGGREFVSIYS